jgi:hypothetical protein
MLSVNLNLKLRSNEPYVAKAEPYVAKAGPLFDVKRIRNRGGVSDDPEDGEVD